MSALWTGQTPGPKPTAVDLIDALHTPPWQPLLARIRRAGRRDRRRPAPPLAIPAVQLEAS